MRAALFMNRTACNITLSLTLLLLPFFMPSASFGQEASLQHCGCVPTEAHPSEAEHAPVSAEQPYVLKNVLKRRTDISVPLCVTLSFLLPYGAPVIN
jgi:hypothetical protein